MLVLGHSELVDGHEVVGLWVLEVDHVGLGSTDAAVGRSVFDCHPIDQEAVQVAVAGD